MSDNSEPSIVHQTGSTANLDHLPFTFIEEPKEPEQPIQDQNYTSSFIANHQHDDNDTDLTTDSDTYLGPTPPTPQMISLTQHQKRHSPLQKEWHVRRTRKAGQAHTHRQTQIRQTDRIRTDRRRQNRQTQSDQTRRRQKSDKVTTTGLRRTSEDTDETNTEQQRSQFAVVEDDESTNRR
jgi:hypothetical protein